MSCLQILILNFIFSKTFAVHEIEFFSIFCTTSAKKSIEVRTCECKDRKVSLELNYVRTIEQHYVRLEFYQLKESKFVQVFKFPSVEWCRLNQNRTSLFNFQKLIIKTLRKGAPAFFHPCPFQGRHQQLNFSPPKDVVEMFPLGTFRFEMLAFDKIDSKLFEITVEFKVYESRV